MTYNVFSGTLNPTHSHSGSSSNVSFCTVFCKMSSIIHRSTLGPNLKCKLKFPCIVSTYTFTASCNMPMANGKRGNVFSCERLHGDYLQLHDVTSDNHRFSYTRKHSLFSTGILVVLLAVCYATCYIYVFSRKL